MRRWFCERLDDAMLPMLKLISGGYHRRLPEYRAPERCELSTLGDLGAPANVTLEPEPSWRGYQVESYRFPSAVNCSCAENQTVCGRLITVDPAAPWAVVVPGYSVGAFPNYSYGFFQESQGHGLLRRGINVALIDLPFHLKRKLTGFVSGEGFFSPDLHETQMAVMQGAADLIGLVRWLEQRSGKPVGLWGTSLGGCVAGLAASTLPELAAVVLMEPLDNPGDVLAVLPGSKEIREALARRSVAAGAMAEALRTVAPSSYRPAVPLERLLFVTPLWDRVVPARFQEAFWEAWGRPQRIVREAGHLTMPTDSAVNRQVMDFLAQWTLGRAQ